MRKLDEAAQAARGKAKSRFEILKMNTEANVKQIPENLSYGDAGWVVLRIGDMLYIKRARLLDRGFLLEVVEITEPIKEIPKMVRSHFINTGRIPSDREFTK